MKERTPALLFDVMDTLVVDPFHRAIPAYFGLTLDDFLAQKHPTAWVEFELGELGGEEYAAKMFSDGRGVDWQDFSAHVRNSYRWVDGMRELVEELFDAGIEMHALSNYPILYRLIDEALDLSRWVKLTFVSCETRIRKPNPEAYLRAARILDREPSECLFIDDRKSNCAAAEAVGMPSLVFTDAVALRAQLGERKIR
jgi:FMN phosphatase YigB (HAD superfamily)